MRKRRLFSALIFAVPVVLAGTFAVAGDSGKSQFKASMGGYQEIATISTAGNGSFEAQLDGDAINYTLTYSDLEGGTVLFAHIHLGARDTNGGVIAFLCGGGGKPACPPAPATVTGTITAANIGGPAAQGIAAGEFEEAVRAVRAGVVYANVHTTFWPGGEIRGQVNDANQKDND